MEQQALFSTSPIARNTDPISSHLAASEITASGIRGEQHRIVLDAVLQYPGRTSFELSRLCNLDRYQVARRLPELEDGNLVKKSKMRKCSITTRKAVTWIAI